MTCGSTPTTSSTRTSAPTISPLGGTWLTGRLPKNGLIALRVDLRPPPLVVRSAATRRPPRATREVAALHLLVGLTGLSTIAGHARRRGSADRHGKASGPRRG